MDDAQIHAMIADACLRSGAADEFARDLRGYLVAQGLAAADVDAIVASPPRLAVYRRLVRHNLFDVVSKMMLRTRARVNAMKPGAFDAAIASFLDDEAPRTHYLRDVPAEFLAWIAPRWRNDPNVPAYALDLARHEHVEFEVGAAPNPPPPPPLADIALDRPLVFAEGIRAMTYAHAVHTLSGSLDDYAAPEEREVTLLVYRDAAHVTRFLELTPLAAAIVHRLMAGETLAAALPLACAERATTLDDATLADVARLLADLGERDVVLGARA